MRLLAWLLLVVQVTLFVLLGRLLLAQAQSLSPAVQLVWDPVVHPQLAGYALQRCQVPAGQSTCTPVDLPGASVGTAVTTYTDTQVTSGVTYRYTAVALCPACTPTRSAASNVVTIQVGAPPATPPVLGAVALLPQTATVATASSQEAGMEARQTLDGQVSTFWHTRWTGTNVPGYPHWLRLNLGTAWWVSGLLYLPRQDMSNGWIKSYRIEGQGTDQAWTVLASGTWASTRSAKEVRWAPVLVVAIRLVALSEIAGQAWASAAEVQLLQGLQP